MATLQRFKFLATQCTTATARSPIVSPSASPSPAKSPSFHLRRHRHRRTLRRLLSRSSSSSTSTTSISTSSARRSTCGRDQPKPDRGEKGSLLARTSLKDLFVSSPSPPPATGSNCRGGGSAAEEELGDGGGWHRRGLGRMLGLEGRRWGGGAVGRFGSGGSLRYRLLRRSWRPVLVTIPE